MPTLHFVWGVQACEAAAGANPAKRRELEDSSRKLGALLWKLNEGQVSQSVSSKLLQVRRLPGALICNQRWCSFCDSWGRQVDKTRRCLG